MCDGLHGKNEKYYNVLGLICLWWRVGNMNKKGEMHAIETIEFWKSTFVKK